MAKAIVGDFDFSIMSESKSDNTLPNNNFKTAFHKMFWLDRSRYGGGTVLYIHENISSEILNDHTISTTISEIIIIDFHQSKRKWLSSVLAFYYTRHENIIVIGDFDITEENDHLSDFV